MKNTKKFLKISLLVFSLVSLLLISLFVFYKLNPVLTSKNVFLEIYYAEAKQAEKGENTILSSSDYFTEQKAVIVKEHKNRIIRETSSQESPLSLYTARFVEGGMGSDVDGNIATSIAYEIKKTDYKVHINYQYNDIYNYESVSENCLSISWKIVVNSLGEEKLILSSEDYQTLGEAEVKSKLSRLGFSEEELEDWQDEGLDLFLQEWFKAYPNSKFSMESRGDYNVFYEKDKYW